MSGSFARRSDMRLRGITLANFKSCSGKIEIPLGRITYLVGPNGAGKSNVLEGIQKIADMLAEGKHVPEPDEYFDNDDDNDMEIGATFELSDKEQHRFIRQQARIPLVAKNNLGPDMPFRFIKYVATPNYNTHLKDEIWLSTDGYKLELFARVRRTGNKFILDRRNIEKSFGASRLPPMTSTSHDNPIHIGELFSLIDSSLLTSIQIMFRAMRFVETDRRIPATVPAKESHEISPTGKNLPNELNDRPRAEQVAFDEILAVITHGDPMGVEPRAVGSDLVLAAHEKGLTRRSRHTDLGSGQLQTLILCWQTFQQDSAIVVLKEPELHMHAGWQKRMLGMIRQKSARDNIQFIIETHSPVFLGTGDDENVLLVSKSEGRTSIVRIAPENMRLIREELGISHADALYNTRVLFVEGESEFAALPIFWRALRSDLGPSPSLFSLGGAGNTKHLRLILEYLKDDDRRFFAILDHHDDALSHVEGLQPDLLPHGGLYILKGSFEDEFTSGQIARAANNLAKKAGLDLRLTHEELDATGSKDGMIKAVKRRWFEVGGASLNKADLAAELARLCGKDNIPGEIRAALEAAAASLGGLGAAGPGSELAAAGAAGEGVP